MDSTKELTRPLTILFALAGSLLACLLALGADSTEAAFPGPDGRIVYAGDAFGGSEILSRRSSLHVSVLTGDAGNNYEPSVSADGSEMIFRSDRDGDQELYRAASDGSGPQRLTTSPGFDGEPAFAADGSFAFRTDRHGNAEIDLSAPGLPLERLTSSPGFDGEPAVSPDGTRIAFRSNRDGDAEIYVSGIDGSTPTRLTTSPGFDGEPAFSPDGSQIAFQSERDGDEEIYRMSADGSAQTRLTENPGADHSPAFSPEGDRVVFVRNLEGAGESLSRIGVDGTGFARVHTGLATDTDPDWGTFPDADGDHVSDSDDDQCLGDPGPGQYGGCVPKRCDNEGSNPIFFSADGIATGTDGDDRILGGLGIRHEVGTGLGGDDCIFGGGGSDDLDGGPGDDYLDGWKGAERLIGGPGSDVLVGDRHGDLFIAGSGRDWLDGGQGKDEMKAGPGRDKLKGGEGDDKLKGGRGGDFLIDLRGENKLNGGPGRDKCVVTEPRRRHRLRNCEVVKVRGR
ncbi:MAG: hypothetical protein WBF18_10950 [Solirubrobacterales bacterium]